jgi:DNA mismatch endonuclease (patch repair protein)
LRAAHKRPEVIAKFSSIHRNQHIKQTKPEAVMHAALGADWLYVGNARLLDGSPNPDAPYADGLPISADIIHRTERIMVMVDGCYWHECPEHGRGRRAYVRRRDARKQRAAEAAGWLVLRVWEHELKEDAAVAACVARIVQRPAA